MIEKRRQNLDKGCSCATLLTDMSKAFDCILHNFLIAKLEAYGFPYEALNVMKNFLPDRTYKTEMHDSCNLFLNLLIGVPKGSILSPLLFNIYICDLFFVIEEETD